MVFFYFLIWEKSFSSVPLFQPAPKPSYFCFVQDLLQFVSFWIISSTAVFYQRFVLLKNKSILWFDNRSPPPRMRIDYAFLLAYLSMCCATPSDLKKYQYVRTRTTQTITTYFSLWNLETDKKNKIVISMIVVSQ